MPNDPLSFEGNVTVFTKALLDREIPRRIAFIRDLGEVATEPEIVNICERSMQMLKGMGTEITGDIPNF